MERRKFNHRFEGAAVLSALLEEAGSPYDAAQVLEYFREARQAGLAPGDIIPTLFPAEPRFSDTDAAQRLFQNLLGLWDVALGQPTLTAAGPRSRTAKPVPPERLGGSPPSPDWVEAARRYLAQEARVRQRLSDSFENRQDALVTWLDEEALSDEGYGVLRALAFELHAMLELGCGAAPVRVDPAALKESPGDGGGPDALLAYADEALFEAEQDEEAPLPAGERTLVRNWSRKLVAALWAARRM
jgi:hypothetical protein